MKRLLIRLPLMLVILITGLALMALCLNAPDLFMDYYRGTMDYASLRLIVGSVFIGSFMSLIALLAVVPTAIYLLAAGASILKSE